MSDLCVSRVPIFAELARADQERVAGLAQPVRFTSGDLVADERSAPRLLVVHRGRLKTSRLTREGTDQLLRVIGPGDFVGESGVLSGAPSNKRVSAVEEGEACAFTHDALRGLLQARPQVALKMLATVSSQLEDAEDRLAALTTTDVATRLAGYLIDLPATFSDGIAEVTLPLPKKDIASLLGTTPESLSRGFARLMRDTMIETKGAKVRLVDFEALDTLTS